MEQILINLVTGALGGPGRDAASGPTAFEIVQKPFYLSERCRMVRG